MIDQEINRKIAELCGLCPHYWEPQQWQEFKPYVEHNQNAAYRCKLCNKESIIPYLDYVPNYCSDLNAMYEVEKYFHSHYDEQKQYTRHLELVCLNGKHSGESSEFATLNATAQQRAEAFLRVKGEWKE